MDYQQEMQKIEEFLHQEYYREAGRSCGAILEKALRDIYEKVKLNPAVPNSKIKELIELEEKIGK